MKQYLRCLIIVALVAMLSSLSTHQPTTVAKKPIPRVAIRASVQAVPAPKTEPQNNPTPAPAPAPVATPPAPVVYPAGCQNYLPLVQQYNWNVNVAMAVMQAENTNCDPAIDNAGTNSDGSVDYGLFQVNSIHADMVGGNLESLRTPSVNIAVAYSLSHNGTNWLAWSTYKSGKYLRYLR